MHRSNGTSRRLLYMVISIMIVLSFTFIIGPRIHPELRIANHPDLSQNTSDVPSQIPQALPIPPNTPRQVYSPVTVPRPVPPTPCKPDLKYKPKFTNSVVDEYTDLGDNGCYNAGLISDEDTLDTEVRCSNAPMNFWLMWTTAREDWKLKHYRVLDSIYTHHPNATIHVLTRDMTADDFSFYASRFKIKHHSLEFEKIFKHTPLYRWYNTAMKNPNVTRHKNFFSHVTDAMRLALLWKYGGVYMDTDAILLQKVDKIRNTIGFQGGLAGNELNGAVLIFDKHHPFLNYAMHSLTRNHDIGVWVSVGPALLTYSTMAWSNLDPTFVRWIPSPFEIDGNVTLPNEPLGTPSISVFTDQFQFYPISWSNSGRVDIQAGHPGVDKLRKIVEKRTYVYHYFNHMLELWNKKISPGTYLFELMQRGCLLACDNNDLEMRIDDIVFSN